MKSVNKIILFFSLVICGRNLYAQDQIRYSDKSTHPLNFNLKTNKTDVDHINDLLDIAWNKYTIAFNSGSNFDDAISYSNNSLSIAKKINYKQGIRRANFILGMCSAANGNYTESKQYHYNALKIALEEGDKVETFKEYYNIGLAYNMLGIYNIALENHFAALKIIRKINAEELFPTSYAGIGNTYINMGNFPEADKYLEDAYTIASKKQSKQLMGEILLYMGNSLLAQTKLDAALISYNSALKLLYDQKSNRYLSEVYHGIARVFQKKAFITRDSTGRKLHLSSSINYLQRALQLDKLIGNKKQIIKDYSELIDAYTELGDYKNALAYYDFYAQSSDSSYYKSPYLKISQLKIKYEAERAAAEHKLEEEKESIEEQAKQSKILSDQKLKQERAIAAEKNKYEKTIAEERVTQEKIRAEKQQMNNMLLMGLIMVVTTSVFLILFLKQGSEKKRAVEKAEAMYKMAELEMQSLRSQLNPHFMFNSLNSIQTLILKNENDISHSYLARFAKLLRILLENADSPLIPLRKEIDFLHLYLQLETLRVPDLRYSISTDSTLDTEQIFIPNMLLQPYVENAIWHGLSFKESDKILQIRISRVNGTVNYEVEDNGIGRKKADERKSVFRKQHKSIGMDLINKRIGLINEQYAAAIKTEITDVIKNNEVSGTLVTIKIPLNFSGIMQN